LDENIRISITKENRDIWFKKKIVRDENETKLRKANVLLLPYDREQYPFPQGTIEVYEYLKDRLSSKVKVGILAEDYNYREIALYSDIANFATILVNIGVGLLVNALWDYVRNKILSKDRDAIIKLEIIHEKDSGENISIKYEGPAKEFNKAVEEVRKLE